MPLARSNSGESNKDVFYELEKYLPQCFITAKESEAKSYFDRLMRDVDKIAKRARRLASTEGGIRTIEQIKDMQQYAKDTIDTLKKSIPILMEYEPLYQPLFEA